MRVKKSVEMFVGIAMASRGLEPLPKALANPYLPNAKTGMRLTNLISLPL